MDLRTMLLLRKCIARILFGAILGHNRKRKRISQKWLSGNGIEIGALHNPLPTTSISNVTYVDRMDNNELLRHYSDLSDSSLVHVDVVDDGESLLSINDMSQDFVIANHFLEHCLNPIGALQAWLRVLKIGGIAYIAVPDKRFTFDYRRTTTTWNHLLEDFRSNAEHSNNVHYIDWIKNVLTIPEQEVENALAYLLQKQYSIHYHTWTADSLSEFLRVCQIDLEFPINRCELIRNGCELIAILKRTNKISN